MAGRCRTWGFATLTLMLAAGDVSRQNGIASVLRLVANTVKVPFTTFHFNTLSQPERGPKESVCCCIKPSIMHGPIVEDLH